MTPDIIQVIQDEIVEDNENDSARLLAQYKAADENTKKVIDEVLVAICGWGMNSLVSLAEQRDYVVWEG